MLAPELFKALSQFFHIIEAALMGYSHHCLGLPPSADASKFRCLKSRTLTGNSRLKIKLRTREAESSIKLNRVQQADRISLKQKLLKIGHFYTRPESALGAGALPSGASLDSTS